mgnify:CR=1 FL=1
MTSDLSRLRVRPVLTIQVIDRATTISLCSATKTLKVLQAAGVSIISNGQDLFIKGLKFLGGINAKEFPVPKIRISGFKPTKYSREFSEKAG